MFLIFGFLVTLQIRSVRDINNSEAKRLSSLNEELLEEKRRGDGLENQIGELEAELEKFRNAAGEGGQNQIILDQLKKAEMLAGSTDMTGPGVTVTISDSEEEPAMGVNENNYVIHDSDLLQIINKLKAAGAEAISVNGERLIITSEISCIGPTVSVNKNSYGAPFVITAIGDSLKLENAIKMRGGIAENLAYWGIKVNVEKSDLLLIKAFSGTITYKYATPTGKGAAQ